MNRSGHHLVTPNTLRAFSNTVFPTERGGGVQRPKVAYTAGVKVPKKKIKKKRPLKGKGKDPSHRPATPATNAGGQESDEQRTVQNWMLNRQRWKDYACASHGEWIRIDYGSETLKGLINAADPRSRLVTFRKTEDLDTGEVIAEEELQENATLQEVLLPPRRPGTQPGGK